MRHMGGLVLVGVIFLGLHMVHEPAKGILRKLYIAMLLGQTSLGAADRVYLAQGGC